MMAEVSLDEAVVDRRLNLNSEDTEELDLIIGSVIDRYNDNKQTPIDVLTISEISSNEDFEALNTSKVQCFTYIMQNLQKIINGEEQSSERDLLDIRLQAEDFAASFLRIKNYGIKKLEIENHIAVLRKSSSTTPNSNIEVCQDPQVRLQHQTDITFCLASLNKSVTEFHQSIEQEIDSLLNLRNFDKAASKIRRIKLFKKGLHSFSSLSDTKELSDLENVFLKRREIFEAYLDFMDNEGGDFDSEVDKDRKSANIIVDGNCDRGYRNGKFYVKDLESGLKLAQNKGGIIFLEDGDYTINTFYDVKLRKLDETITIIGSSTSDCSIHGTIKIQSLKDEVIFKRVKLEIGSSPESKDAIFIAEGSVKFTECLIEATVNTLFFVLNGSNLSLDHCIVDGLESCQRCVSVRGDGSSVHIRSSWVRDMFSVVTITEEDAVTNLSLSIDQCEIDGVQTAVTATKVRLGSINLQLNSFNMVLYSDEEPSHVLSLCDSGDKGHEGNLDIEAHKNLIKFHHIDGKAFQIDRVPGPGVKISKTRIVTDDSIDRKLAICEAVSVSNIKTLVLEQVEVSGFRIGVSVHNTMEAMITNCTFDKCSVGIYTPHTKERTRSLVKIKDTEIKTTYYGFLIFNSRTRVSMKSVKFLDVPKPLLLKKAVKEELMEDSCSYLLTRDYTSSRDFRLLEQEMNLHLATQENIAHRTAYDRDEVEMIFRYGVLGYSNNEQTVKNE